MAVYTNDSDLNSGLPRTNPGTGQGPPDCKFSVLTTWPRCFLFTTSKLTLVILRLKIFINILYFHLKQLQFNLR